MIKIIKSLTIFVFMFVLFNPAITHAEYQVIEVANIDPLSWYAVTSDSTGQYLAAILGESVDGYIHTSSDYGVTWTEQTGSGLRDWRSITSDSTGQYLAAVVYGGLIYTSSDYGETWTEQIDAGSRLWSAITSDSTGQYLAAGVVSGLIHTSSDYGVTWVEQAGSGSRIWLSITSDSTGQYLATTDTFGRIYTSSDYGVIWTERLSVGFVKLPSITSDSTGQYLAFIRTGFIYTSSDYGENWETLAKEGFWQSITSDSTGQYLAVTASDGFIHISSDYGETWTEQTDAGSRLWTGIASSDSGGRLVAVVKNGGIYTLYNPSLSPPIPVPQVSEPAPRRRSGSIGGRVSVPVLIQTPQVSQEQTSQLSTTIEGLQTLVAQLQTQLQSLLSQSSGFIRDLELGMEGPDVTQLQQLLISKGYTIPAGATGFFGQQTQQALINFQQANNITPAVGYFGSVTRGQITQ